MLTKKFVKRSFTFKFYVKVWSCNRPLRNTPSYRIRKICIRNTPCYLMICMKIFSCYLLTKVYHLVHSAVCSCYRTFIRIYLGRVITEERDTRKYPLCIKRINLSITLIFWLIYDGRLVVYLYADSGTAEKGVYQYLYIFSKISGL